MIGFLTYLTLPIQFGAVLYVALILGAFPPESDSIAIPFAAFVLLWIVFGAICAFLLGAVYIGTRREGVAKG